MGVVVKIDKTKLVVDVNALLRVAAEQIITLTKLRTDKGLDVNGKSFAPYSDAYRKRKNESGDTTPEVNLRVTGGMMSSLSMLDVEDTETFARCIIAPDTSHSNSARMLRRRNVSTKELSKEDKKAELRRRRIAKQTSATRQAKRELLGGEAGVTSTTPHNIVGFFHQTGTGHLPKREWLGITPSEYRELMEELARLAVLKRK